MNPLTIIGIIVIVLAVVAIAFAGVYCKKALKKAKQYSAEAENEKKRILDEAQKAAETKKKEALIESMKT